jgi:tetratricopeptide (TPR) repeat protein
MRKEHGSKIEIAASYNNVGNFYTDISNYPKALEFFQASLDIRKRIDDKRGIVKLLSNIGFIYQKMKINAKALENYRGALILAEEIGDDRCVTYPLRRISSYYIETNDYEQAYPYVMRCLKIARKIGAKSLQMGGYSKLAKIYEHRGDYKKALEYFTLYTQIEQAIFSQKARVKITKLNTQHEIEKKEKENELLKKESQTRKLKNRLQIIISISVVLLLTATLIIIFKHYRYYKNEVHRKEERQRRLELESKLKLLGARINPHFLFNSLDSIRELGYEQDPRKLEKLIHHLSDMYRQILYSSETLLTPLENEIIIVKDYLEIEKRMMKGLLAYHINIDDELRSFQIMPLSIEILVENSVTHGITPKGRGTVTVSVYKKNKFVLIEITDDGVGFDIKTLNPGFGLYSIQERLKLYYQDKAKFNINSFPGKGTRAIMELPYA